MMYCAQCGLQMVRRDDGPWNICCNGIGYWYNGSPLPRDGWWPVTTYKGFTFYPTVKWPKEFKPTNPQTQNWRSEMQTRGERYVYKPGEKEAIEQANVMIKEAFDLLSSAKRTLENAGSHWTIEFYYDEDANGNYRLPENFDTTLTVDARTNADWLSSYQDC